MVYVSGVINLPDECPGGIGGLTTGEDVKVVVCGVSAGVAFGADGCAKDDDVFGDTGVQKEHAPHSAAGIVEKPFIRVLPVGIPPDVRVVLDQFFDEGVDHKGGVGRRGGSGGERVGEGEGGLDRGVEGGRVEDVEFVVDGVGPDVKRGEDSEEQTPDAPSPETPGRVGGRGGSRGVFASSRLVGCGHGG